jgi:UDP-N-acetylglucosamine 2-epimerase (non-hydrolysing)
VVGNTIVEVSQDLQTELFNEPKKNSQIILDIHRPENFNDKTRLKNIITYANKMGTIYNLPVNMLNFGRTEQKLKEWNILLENIKLVPLMSYKDYITTIYHSKFIISDSGTAQEEPCLFQTQVIVPRDFTERPESVTYNCSIMIDVNTINNESWDHSISYLDGIINDIIHPQVDWLGEGETSKLIVNKIKELYKNDRY